MRQPAQRTIALQGCMPADRESAGVPNPGQYTREAINRAFREWQKRRGIVDIHPDNYWKRGISNRPPAEPKPKPVPRPKLTEVERLERKRQRARDWRDANREKVRAQNADYKRRRVLTPEQLELKRARNRAYVERNKELVRERARNAAAAKRLAMTPEQRKAESERIKNYRNGRKHTR